MSLLRVLGICACIGLMGACAKQGYPSGGPKDETPPKVTKVTPSNETLRFIDNHFVVEFDEYIQLKDADNNILISPPMNPKPEYNVKGRKLEVVMKDTLQPNMTYLFQFRGAVTDFNEGNPLESFEYAFSTGDVIDSMTLNGMVVDALTHTPNDQTVAVFAYPADAPDSAVVNTKPSYVTRCDKSGSFVFSHIQPGSYRIVALTDADKNLRYNNDESIAWSSDPITSHLMIPALSASDTATGNPIDTTATPTKTSFGKLTKKQHTDTNHSQLTLYISKPESAIQRIVASDFLQAGRVQIVTLLPMKVPQIVCEDSLMWVANTKKDTLNIWTLRPTCDSLKLIVADNGTIIDTLDLYFRAKRSKKMMKGPSSVKQQTTTLAQFSFGSTANFFDTLLVKCANPIRTANKIQDSVVEIMNLKDSSVTWHSLVWDSNGLRPYIDFTPKAGAKYRFRIASHRFNDIYGNSNDSLSTTTEFNTPESFGNIIVTCTVSEPFVRIQLLNEKNDIVQDSAMRKATQIIRFQYLKAGKYRLRAIYDQNNNGKWDPGDYWKHQQPEKVVYFEKTLELRANWDMEEKWNLNSVTQPLQSNQVTQQ